MLELYIGDTNIANPLDESQMNALIETFVAVHGEGRREIITERLKGAKFLFLPRVLKGELTGNYRWHYLKDAVERVSDDKVGEINSQYQFIVDYLKNIWEVSEDICKLCNSEIHDAVLLVLPELFGMTKEEFKYNYTKNQREIFIDTYLDILSRDKENFDDEDTLTSYMKKEYLEFFKSMGVHLGNSLSDYANNTEFMDMLFDEDLLDEIREIKTKYEILKLQKDPFFQDAVKEIQSLDVIGGDLTLIQTVYRFMYKLYDTSALVLPYMKKDGSCGSICLLPLEWDLSRETLMHECEHIVEMCFVQTENGSVISKAGFDTMVYELEGEDYDGDNLDFGFEAENSGDRTFRKLEITSEIWNDFFARILYHNSKERGLAVGRLGLINTWYVKAMGLLSKIDAYCGRVLDARMSKDLNAFENLFGGEIANELNELANKYVNLIWSSKFKFGGFESHLKRLTGLTIPEIDFSNLPEDDWTDYECECIKLHQEMENLAKRIDEHFSGGAKMPLMQEENE